MTEVKNTKNNRPVKVTVNNETTPYGSMKEAIEAIKKEYSCRKMNYSFYSNQLKNSSAGRIFITLESGLIILIERVEK